MKTKVTNSWKSLALLLCMLIGTTAVFAQPTITSFGPTSGPVGSNVNITGTNFNTTLANNIVFFGATQASVTAASLTSLTVTVPMGANFDYIKVTNLGTNLTAYSAYPFIVTFSCGGTAFASKVDITTGTSPYCVAIGDIDGDGKADLIVPDYNSPYNISVFRNTSTVGTISFAAKVDFAAYPGPWGLAIGDLDGDGKLDVAVANNNSPYNISVFRNTSTPGTISFATRVDYATGNLPYMIAIGDLDGDGKPDIASPNAISSTVSTFRNLSTPGTISFAAKVDFPAVSNSEGIAIGDMDGDGKSDMIVAGYGSGVASVFRNTSTLGTINFAAKVDFTTASNPAHVALGDLNGDGKLDIAMTSFPTNSFSALRNTSTPGTISFAAKVDITTGTYPDGIAMGDLDGDGKPDVVVADYTVNTISTLKNTSTAGAISFATKIDYAAGAHVYGVAIGDMDGDGKADIAAANANANTVSTFRNTCDIFTAIATTPSESNIQIYPNPATDQINIVLNTASNVEVSIIDITGKTLYALKETSNKTLVINTNDFANGIYFVKIQGDDFLKTEKLIIAK